MTITKSRLPVIFMLNMWNIRSKEDLQEAEKIEFIDYQAIVDAGWVVD